MRNSNRYLLSIVTSVVLFACTTPDKNEQAGYQAKFVTGSTNNKIEILDFGGTGQPILFLSGLGNSAHVFVDFAPKFTGNFHVYAMSRRGFGASAQTAEGYHIDTLSNDILAVIKSLNLDKVILIGHSIAGEEISRFASSYPDKVIKVIYLDAAYDRKNFMSAIVPHMPPFPSPNAKDSSSLVNIKTWAAKVSGVAMPDDEIKNTSVFSKEGRYLKDLSPGAIQGKIISGVEVPNYPGIQCPALAIYAIAGSVQTLFPFYDLLDAGNKSKADTCFSLYKTIVNEEMALFKKEVKKGVVKEVQDANHYVYISHPAETEKLIRDFLK